jgi:hypothetical protein
VPPAKTAVRLELEFNAMVAGLAPKLVIVGGGTTVTVTVWVTAVPLVGVTVRVYVVVAAGLTLTAVPLVTGRLPGVITPVPLTKSANRLELEPAPICAGVATKLVIAGAVALYVTVVIMVTAVPMGFVTVRV